MASEFEPYENLANAIIISAAEDYRVALRRQMRHPDGQETKHSGPFGELFPIGMVWSVDGC